MFIGRLTAWGCLGYLWLSLVIYLQFSSSYLLHVCFLKNMWVCWFLIYSSLGSFINLFYGFPYQPFISLLRSLFTDLLIYLSIYLFIHLLTISLINLPSPSFLVWNLHDKLFFLFTGQEKIKEITKNAWEKDYISSTFIYSCPFRDHLLLCTRPPESLTPKKYRQLAGKVRVSQVRNDETCLMKK